jgi:hypothetical protein
MPVAVEEQPCGVIRVRVRPPLADPVQSDYRLREVTRMRWTTAVVLAAMGPGWGWAQSPSDPDVQFFEAKVRPLLAKSCFPCHSQQAGKKRGGLQLDSRTALLQGGDSGPAVVPGRPEASLLVKAVRQADPQLQMPPTGKLPVQEVVALEEWIRRGAAYPGGGATGKPAPAIDLTEGRKLWSLQPVRPAAPPTTRQQAWQKKPIDGFLLAELEKRGLEPAPPAPRRALIRRATFDLVGLPPTPEEVAAFLADPAPDAYERLIDRLLASPHYGERWGRHWLDLTRYADVGENFYDSRGAPHLYRDWVVQAVNADVPYDRFVQLQLAADLMPDARPADLAALGFLGLSPQYWKELKLDHLVIKAVVAEEWEERISTIGGTFLGLTVACARCHDHKFDPITTQDYYALAGVLASTQLAERWLLPEAQAAAVRQAREEVRTAEERLKKLNDKKGLAPPEQEERQALQARIAALTKTPGYDAPSVPGLAEASLQVLPDGPHRTKLVYKAGEPQDVAVQVRGNPGNLGPVVPRRFLAVLSAEPPTPFTRGSGRLELARAIVTDAAPLAARVFVNRVWRHHFGAGLVETPSDFGRQGDPPSHPQLLDDLAARFIANGWSLRWLHREIMLSAAYQQSSTVARPTAPEATDPANRLLWRMNRRRLDVESWRDAMLAVTGTLDRTIGGPSRELSDLANHRRTLYGTVKRRELNDLLRLHDFPDPTTHNPTRLPTTTPLQQLFTLNSPFLQQQAAALVKRLHGDAPGKDGGRIRRAYALLFGRPATETEVHLGLEFLAGGPAGRMWEQYAHVLLSSNEFLFVD